MLALQHDLVCRDRVELVPVPKGTTVDSNFEKAITLLSTSKGLLKQYTALSDEVTSSDDLRLSKQEWKGDVLRMDDIIMSKGNQVKNQVQRRLAVAKSRFDEASRDRKASDPRKDAWDYLIPPTNEGQGEASGAAWDPQAMSWGGAARNAKKGIKRLVRYLPEA